MPPIEASRRRAISLRERISKPPRGEMRALTVGRGLRTSLIFRFFWSSVFVISNFTTASSRGNRMRRGRETGAQKNGRCRHRPFCLHCRRVLELVTHGQLCVPLRFAAEVAGVERLDG